MRLLDWSIYGAFWLILQYWALSTGIGVREICVKLRETP